MAHKKGEKGADGERGGLMVLKEGDAAYRRCVCLIIEGYMAPQKGYYSMLVGEE